MYYSVSILTKKQIEILNILSDNLPDIQRGMNNYASELYFLT